MKINTESLINDYTDLAKSLHEKIYTIDSHCDTPIFFRYGIDIGKVNRRLILSEEELGEGKSKTPVEYDLKVDLPKMRAGALDAVFMVAYLKQGPRDAETVRKVVRKTEETVREIIRQVDRNKDAAEIARSSEDLKRLKLAGKKAIFIGIENGYGIGDEVANLRLFRELGVSYITLSHNGDNAICDAAMESLSEHNGLSAFGVELVREMNRLGMMVDISHTSEKTSFDALEVSHCPIIASHSSAKALCPHPRNVSDRLMRAIARRGGVVQVCIYPWFLRTDGEATVRDLVDHIDHLAQVAGVEHVGIGSDFDGGGGITGVESADQLMTITVELLRRGYSPEAIGQIWGGNLMRVMDIVQKQREI